MNLSSWSSNNSSSRRSVSGKERGLFVRFVFSMSAVAVVALMSRNRVTVAAAAATATATPTSALATRSCRRSLRLWPKAFLQRPWTLQQRDEASTQYTRRAPFMSLSTISTTTTACYSSTPKQGNDAAAAAVTMNDDVDMMESESTLPAVMTQYTLATITYLELSDLLVNTLKYPKFRVDQVWHWIREKGILTVNDMSNVPKKLKDDLVTYCVPSTLRLVAEQVSAADGTIKRAYQIAPSSSSTSLSQKPILIESVLMGPYNDGHYTACISSQAGCAQGCVFCATGQMGLVRQLTANEIFDQVVQFATLLQRENERDALNDKQQEKKKPKRLSNIVFMGMGEPLANYQAVRTAVNRITTELNISARKITISTVGIVPKIRQLMVDANMPPVRLAVSLHCADNDERTALLPANQRNGGLDTLMTTLKEYIDTTGRRLTLEWALIAGENDSIHTARTLGRLIVQQHQLRPDMVHINVIPLNPTSLYAGHASRKQAVNAFCQTLQQEFGISCTPRVRRGIDIDAGCGQLTTALLLQEQEPKLAGKDDTLAVLKTDETSTTASMPPLAPVRRPVEPPTHYVPPPATANAIETLDAHHVAATDDDDDASSYDFDHDDFDNPELESRFEQQEANRLVNLIQGTTINLSALSPLLETSRPMKNVAPPKGAAAPTKTKTRTTGTRPKATSTSTSSPPMRQSSTKSK